MIKKYVLKTDTGDVSIAKVNTESGEITFIYTVYYCRRNGHATALVANIKKDLDITLTAKVALKNKASNALFTKIGTLKSSDDKYNYYKV